MAGVGSIVGDIEDLRGKTNYKGQRINDKTVKGEHLTRGQGTHDKSGRLVHYTKKVGRKTIPLEARKSLSGP